MDELACPGATVREGEMTIPAGTLAEERWLRPDGADFAACGVPRCGRLWSGAVVVRQQSGNGGAGRAVPAISLPRLAARQAAREAAAPHRTPRPGEGRAPTTAG